MRQAAQLLHSSLCSSLCAAAQRLAVIEWLEHQRCRTIEKRVRSVSRLASRSPRRDGPMRTIPTQRRRGLGQRLAVQRQQSRPGLFCVRLVVDARIRRAPTVRPGVAAPWVAD